MKRSKTRSAASSAPLDGLTVFLDEGLGNRILPAALRAAGLVVVPHVDRFDSGTPDSVWLAAAGREGWIVISKDDRIRYRESEKSTLLRHGVRAFILSSGNLAGADMAASIIGALPRMTYLIRRTPPPFIATITSTSAVRLILPRS